MDVPFFSHADGFSYFSRNDPGEIFATHFTGQACSVKRLTLNPQITFFANQPRVPANILFCTPENDNTLWPGRPVPP